MRHYNYILGLLILLSGCQEDDLKNSRFKGTWTIEQTLANDSWGGPFYWRDVDWDKQIKFTSEECYEKTSSDFELIGIYKVISDSKIEITWTSPTHPQHPTFQLDYEFDNERQLIIYKNQTEGIIAEKYKLTSRF